MPASFVSGHRTTRRLVPHPIVDAEPGFGLIFLKPTRFPKRISFKTEK
jgi:hypothetical protein